MNGTTTATNLGTLLTALEGLTKLPHEHPQHATLPKGSLLVIGREAPDYRKPDSFSQLPSLDLIARKNITVSWYVEKSHGLPKSRTQYALCMLENIFQIVPEARRENFFAQLGKRIAPEGILAITTNRDFAS